MAQLNLNHLATNFDVPCVASLHDKPIAHCAASGETTESQVSGGTDPVRSDGPADENF